MNKNNFKNFQELLSLKLGNQLDNQSCALRQLNNLSDRIYLKLRCYQLNPKLNLISNNKLWRVCQNLSKVYRSKCTKKYLKK